MQPHIRAFVERAQWCSRPAPTATARGSARGALVEVGGVSIADVSTMQITPELAEWVAGLDEPSVAPLLKSLGARSTRSWRSGSATCGCAGRGHASGGESQRTRMIRHLGSSLTDVTYVFDEPTIGLHPARHPAHERPAGAAARQGRHGARAVEHKPEVIDIADHVVDLGPRTGSGGGEIVFEGRSRGCATPTR